MPCVFAAGDVRRSSVNRVASAVGEGSIAIRLVQTLLADEEVDVVGVGSRGTGRARLIARPSGQLGTGWRVRVHRINAGVRALRELSIGRE